MRNHLSLVLFSALLPPCLAQEELLLSIPVEEATSPLQGNETLYYDPKVQQQINQIHQSTALSVKTKFILIQHIENNGLLIHIFELNHYKKILEEERKIIEKLIQATPNTPSSPQQKLRLDTRWTPKTKSLQTRLKYQYHKSNHQWGIQLEKDPHEKWLWDSPKKPFGYAAFHLQYQIKNYRVLLGDYRLSIGDGLLFNNLNLLRFSPNFIQLERPSILLKPHTSFDEYHYLRGIALEYQKGPIQVYSLISRKKLPVRKDQYGHVTSFTKQHQAPVSPYLAVHQSVLLNAIQWQSSPLRIALTQLYHGYSESLYTEASHSPLSRTFLDHQLDFSLAFANQSIRLEGVRQNHGGMGWTANYICNFAQNSGIGLHFSTANQSFHNWMSSTLFEQKITNKRIFYQTLQLQLAPKHSILATTRFVVKIPRPSNTSSRSEKTALLIRYTFEKRKHFQTKLFWDFRQSMGPSNPLNWTQKWGLYAQWIFDLHNQWRIWMEWGHKDGQRIPSRLISFQCVLGLFENKLRLRSKLSLIDNPGDYDLHYHFEYSLSRLSVLSYNQSGIRWMSQMSIALHPNIKLTASYAHWLNTREKSPAAFGLQFSYTP